ncbi:Autophagy protein 22 [Podochytrium sp. JEL0797]|nr:Autophagy protein 22 [Podochytrium sp. JEL0797]
MTDMELTPVGDSSTTHLLSHEFRDIDDQPVAPAELRAWYFFSACAESISFSQAFFIPLIVQGLATGGGFQASDHTVPCDTKIVNYSCVVPIGSGWMDTSSFYFITVSISTFLQLILFIAIGSIADHGAWRKKFMLGFSLLGSIACIAFVAIVQPGNFWFGAVLAVCVAVTLGSTWVFNYAFLPPFARNHPMFLEEAKNPDHTRESLLTKLDFVTNYISSMSFTFMYSGALVLLFLIVALNLLLSFPASFPSDYGLHVGVAIGGLLWLIGSLVAAKYMRDRPGPPIPAGENIVLFSTKQVFTALSEARKLSNLFTYLLGWFLYSDSFNTLVSVSVLWAKDQLGFTSTEILLLAAEVPILALIGSFCWNFAQRKFGIETKRLLLIQNAVYVLIPLWGVLSFIPNSPVGYQHKLELFIGAGIHSLILGATQSTCRSMFAQLLPAGSESKFFCLYEVSDKGSGWVGPLVVSAIQNSGGNKAFTFLFLVVQFAVSWVLFSRIDVVKGVEEGKVYGVLEREREEEKKETVV